MSATIGTKLFMLSKVISSKLSYKIGQGEVLGRVHSKAGEVLVRDACAWVM